MSGIFLSYSRADRELAERIVKGLRGLGADVWWDEDMPGVDWRGELQRQIDELSAVLVIWTPSSSQSKNVMGEARLGDRKDKLVNVVWGVTAPPSPFDVINALPLQGWTGRESHHGWARVVRTVEDFLVRSGGIQRGELTAALSAREAAIRQKEDDIAAATEAFQLAQQAESTAETAQTTAAQAHTAAEDELRWVVERRASQALVKAAQEVVDATTARQEETDNARRDASSALSSASRRLTRAKTDLDRMFDADAPSTRAPDRIPQPVTAPAADEPVEEAPVAAETPVVEEPVAAATVIEPPVTEPTMVEAPPMIEAPAVEAAEPPKTEAPPQAAEPVADAEAATTAAEPKMTSASSGAATNEAAAPIQAQPAPSLSATASAPAVASTASAAPAGRSRPFRHVVGLMLRPRSEWAIIDGETTSNGALLIYAAVLAGVSAFCGGLGAVFTSGNFAFAPEAAVGAAIFTPGVVMLCALLVNLVASRFGGVKDFNQALKLTIYANTASWVVGLLGVIPIVSVVAFFAGPVYQIVLFSLGMSRVMHTPPNKTVGAVLVTYGCYLGVISAFVLTALVVGLAHGG